MCNTFNFEGIKWFLSFSKKEIVEFCSNYLKNVELFTILRVILKLLTVSQVLLRRQPKCLKLGRLPFSTENFKFDLSTGIYGRHIVLKKYYKPFIYYMQVKSGKCNVTNCSQRLAIAWISKIAHANQQWKGQNLFKSKGFLNDQLKLWWHPPQLPAPSFNSIPSVTSYYLKRLFMLMPRS